MTVHIISELRIAEERMEKLDGETVVTETYYNQFKDSENIGFDIETTGLGADSMITVVEFYPDADSNLVILNVDGSEVDDAEIKSNIETHVSADLDVLLVDSEEALLTTFSELLSNHIESTEQRLYSFNGLTWYGGFDIPHIRTRLSVHDISGECFDSVYHADLYPEIKRQFNTKQEEDDEYTSCDALDDAHDLLCSCSVEDVFDDSEEAVTAYKNEEYAAVIAHCHADVARTSCVKDIVQEYIGDLSDVKDSGYIK